MNELVISVTDGTYNYGQFQISYVEIIKTHPTILTHQTKKHRKKFSIDPVFVHYLMKELAISDVYRYCFVNYNLRRRFKTLVCDNYVFHLKPTRCDLIDYNWNERLNILIRERVELDHTLSWLSTLGGAFSALGDYKPHCAEKAGVISIHQLKLALRLGDPIIQARCRLYFSLSLIQRKYFKLAREIIYKEYLVAKNSVVIDKKLLNMCKGIWAKLQYEQRISRTMRRA